MNKQAFSLFGQPGGDVLKATAPWVLGGAAAGAGLGAANYAMEDPEKKKYDSLLKSMGLGAAMGGMAGTGFKAVGDIANPLSADKVNPLYSQPDPFRAESIFTAHPAGWGGTAMGLHFLGRGWANKKGVGGILRDVKPGGNMGYLKDLDTNIATAKATAGYPTQGLKTLLAEREALLKHIGEKPSIPGALGKGFKGIFGPAATGLLTYSGLEGLANSQRDAQAARLVGIQNSNYPNQ